MKNNHNLRLFSASLVFFLVVVACGLQGQTATDLPADTPGVVAVEDTPGVVLPTDTVRPTVAHVSLPGELPGGWLSEITDRDTSSVAAEHRALGGENFSVNLFERPFNTNTMDKYFPDLDITRARLFEDSQWVYVAIRLSGLGEGGTLGGNYGVEVDLDVDGRGDLLVFAATPGAQWSTDGVRVWADVNNDVGSDYPIYSDAPVSGDGYETLSFDAGYGSDPDLAWARLAPDDQNSVQIAFKLSLLNNDNKFTWGAWADRSILNPAWYDYNDHFTAAEAGSPLTESADYPVKALYELDNTCRWGVGFTPTGSEPGVCPVPATLTPTLPGTISGTVYYNGVNSDLSYHPFSTPVPDIPVTLRSGGCGSPGSILATTNTNGSGNYSFTVDAGTYCVSADTPSSNQTGPQTVTVSNGGSATVNFFYYTYLGMR